MTQPAPLSPLPAADEDAAFLSRDPRFAAVTGDSPRLVEVVATDAHEGPVYVADEDALYFTTLPRREASAPRDPQVSINRLALDGERFPLQPERVSTVRADANAANGMALDPEGRLIVCEQGSLSRQAGITRVDRASGEVTAVVDSYCGLVLNSPNDVVVKSDGSIWFTDPSYGSLQGFRPRPELGDRVYRYEPRSGRLSIVADSLDKPNGLAFSPDERVLYVTDSGANQEPGSFYAERPHHVFAFDVLDGRHLAGGGRSFAVVTPGFPDGIKVDSEGRVYVSSSGGVLVLSPEGELLGEIALPGAVNFTFGGPEHNILFITTDDAIWAAVLSASGVEPLGAKRLKGV
jgi:gluconolactonase